MDSDTIQSTATTMTHKRRAFTLVELLLALAITGMVAAAVAAMLVAVSYGTSSRRDLRGVVVKAKVVDARIGSAIRGSRAILETGTDYLVLWTADTNPNGAAEEPDLSEIRLIERGGGDDTLSSYGFPDTWTQAQIDAANVSYTLTGNPAGFFQGQADAAKTAGSFQQTLWGTGVTSLLFVLDNVDPATTSLASYELTLNAGDLSETVVGAASIRYGTVNSG